MLSDDFENLEFIKLKMEFYEILVSIIFKNIEKSVSEYQILFI